MSIKKLGSTKLTDDVLVSSVNLASSEVAGILGVANGGTGQSVFTNGQLLIGNTTGNTLTKATLTAGSGISITNGAGSISIAATAVSSQWTTNGSDIYYNTGSVGIGTASPGQLLDVVGRIRSRTSTVGSSDIIAESTASTGTGYARLYLKNVDREWRFIADGTVSGSPLYIYDGTVGTVRQTINSSGYVGFGTTNPETNLHIYNSGQPPIVNSLYANLLIGTDSTANFQRIRFDVGTTPYWGLTRIGTSNNFAITGRISSTWSDNVFVIQQSTGYVGISTGAPEAPIDLGSGSSGVRRFIAYNGSTGNANGIGLDMGGNSYEMSLFFAYGTSDNGRLTIGSHDGTTYRTKLTVRGNGAVSIGTTAAPLYGLLRIDGGLDMHSNPLRLYNGNTFYAGIGSAAWAIGGSASELAVYADNATSIFSGAARRMYFASNGNIGINTTGPSYQLVISNAGAAGIEFGATNGNYGEIYAYNRATASAITMLLQGPGGYVGIGTTAAGTTATLTVAGVIRSTNAAVDANVTDGAFRFYDGSTFRGGFGTDAWAHSGGSATDLVLYMNGGNLFFSNSGTRTAVYTSGGSLGIGTTSPSTQLHVKSSGSYGTITSDTSTNTGGGAFGVRKNGAVIGYLINKGAWLGDTTNDLCVAAETGYNVRIYTNGSGTERFIFTTGGRLGIGITSPSLKLSLGSDTGRKFFVYDDGGGANDIGGGMGTDLGGFSAETSLFFGNYSGNGRFTIGAWTSSQTYSTKVTVLANGRVGIGTTAPSAPLNVVHTNLADPYAGIVVKNTDTTGAAYTGVVVDAVLQSHIRFMLNGNLKWQWRVGNGNGTDDMRLYSWTAGTDIMTVATSQAVTFSSTVTASDFVLSSDRRRKTELVRISDALAKVLAWAGYTYRPIDDERRRAGLMAQDVEATAPEVVYTDNDGYKSMSYEQTIPYLVEAIRDLHRMVEALA